MQLTTITDETRLAVANLAERATGLVTPTVRLGVTGLARAGKTVFITALVHNLVHGGRLPLFSAYSSRAASPAPRWNRSPTTTCRASTMSAMSAALVDDRIWPDSTRRISELRLTIEFESASFSAARSSSGRLHLDIVDYPGEWLLDLALLVERLRRPGRAKR